MPTNKNQIIQRERKYWEERFRDLENATHKTTNLYFNEIEKQYRLCIEEIKKELSNFYKRYAENENITVEEAQALLTPEELERFRMNVNEYILKAQENATSFNIVLASELERASLAYRISRLQELEMYLKIQANQLMESANANTFGCNYVIYNEVYLRSAYEIFKGTGIMDLTFIANESVFIEDVLKRPWTSDGTTFSEKIWINQNTLIDNLVTELSKIVNDGDSYITASRRLNKVMNTGLSNCKRLIHTESAYFSSLAQHECYTELGVEKYQFYSELNTGVCSICGSLDSKVFNMKDRQVGVNAVPMHPNCRCVEAPYIDNSDIPGYIPEMRSGRNSEGMSVLFPGNLTYKEWKEKYAGGMIDRIAINPSIRLGEIS